MDLEDIICAFKNTEPDQTPIFVAKELHKLPPVTFDHVDVTRLLKYIILLQTEVKHIKQTYATSEELLELKNIVNTSGPSDEHVNKRRGAYLFDSGPPGILNFSNMSVVNSSPDQDCAPSATRKQLPISVTHAGAKCSASEGCLAHQHPWGRIRRRRLSE